jgi:hypothetical protein
VFVRLLVEFILNPSHRDLSVLKDQFNQLTTQSESLPFFSNIEDNQAIITFTKHIQESIDCFAVSINGVSSYPWCLSDIINDV